MSLLAKSRRRQKSDRIEQVEQGVRALLNDHEVQRELAFIAKKLELRRTGLLDSAWYLWDRIEPHFRYRDDTQDMGGGAVQVIRRPSSILSVGGNCDDALLLFGGLLCHEYGPEGIFSVYLPSAEMTKHVVVGIQDPLGTGRYIFDICSTPGFPAQRGPVPGNGPGLWVSWA